MSVPECQVCKTSLETWSGNVMVDSNKYPRQIDELIIVCKNCTNKLDRTKSVSKLHNIWELGWVKDNANKLKNEVARDQQDQTRIWSAEAVQQLNKLSQMAGFC